MRSFRASRRNAPETALLCMCHVTRTTTPPDMTVHLAHSGKFHTGTAAPPPPPPPPPSSWLALGAGGTEFPRPILVNQWGRCFIKNFQMDKGKSPRDHIRHSPPPPSPPPPSPSPRAKTTGAMMTSVLESSLDCRSVGRQNVPARPRFDMSGGRIDHPLPRPTTRSFIGLSDVRTSGLESPLGSP